MSVMKSLGAALIAATLATAALADLPVLRASVLKFGTVNWELSTIKHHNLDHASGITIEVNGVATGSAAKIAFQAGETDVIVSDWIWVARQRAAGHDFVFIPYSLAVGGIMVPGDSATQTLADLAGDTIAIAGGPLDKSWLILRAYAQKNYGFDLANETRQVFGAPPLIFGAARSGEVEAAINFWHFNAKTEAAGFRSLLSVHDAAVDLGLDPQLPLLGYVVRGTMVEQNPELINGLVDASHAAKGILALDDAEWSRLRPQMNAANDAEFDALVEGFRAGIPVAGPIDEAAAARMLTLMYDLGGADLLGDASTLPSGVFVQSAP